jgi:GR25 family glycosyltransferase involved in LPS biosynthesis
MTSNIEHIFYINLAHRIDRRSEMEQELEKMGLIHKAERFDAVLMKPGAFGCGYSHIGALKLAKERGYKNVLILEDDFMFVVNKETLEEQCKLFFENVKTYNVCMLSYNTMKSEDCIYPFLYKVIDSHTASGYLVNENFYDILIDNFETAMKNLKHGFQHWLYSIDQSWKTLQPTSFWYQFKIRIGMQRRSYSDISDREVYYGDC